MNNIQPTAFNILFGNESYKKLSKYIEEQQFSKIFILVDNNTLTHCLSVFKRKFNIVITYEVLVIDAGEKHKNLKTCEQVWNELVLYNADRKSLIINLGGGLVSDLGGFVASTYKRGIKFINIPTSLLSMVDAAIGGKTGVDFGKLKNIIGVFSNPEIVLIDEEYLLTLPKREFKSGLAEVIKYGYINDIRLLNEVINGKELENKFLIDLINASICIKKDIVQADFEEKNLRKILNFGHTIGHAIESFYLNTSKELLHGEAIAAGMVVELYISYLKFNFPLEDIHKLKQFVINYYGKVPLKYEHLNDILTLLHHDKKNEHSKVLFVLLKAPQLPIIDCDVEEDIIIKALNYYID
ncbi:MAG: 3-dehydroquinate synthase [Bacteroidetes bacterium]|nr:3-dehydroquinate synthase [Bacteroidota bacterium]